MPSVGTPIAGGLDTREAGLAGTIPSTYEVYRLAASGTITKDAVGNAEIYSGPVRQVSPQGGTFYWYPWLHLLSDGQFFMAGFARPGSMALHDPAVLATAWNYGVGTLPPPYTYPVDSWGHFGSSVLLPINFNAVATTRDRVLRMGGQLGFPGTNGVQVPYLKDVDECTPLGAITSWQQRPLLKAARKHCNAVLLPDGSVVLIGGESEGGYHLHAERLVGDTRVLSDEMGSVRDYHSTAVLLPDGRVFLAGGNHRDYDYQIYLQPYLSAGPRPVVTSAPATLVYDTGFVVQYTLSGTSDYASKVILMRPCSTTHHYDSEQRLLELKQINDPVPGTFYVKAPPSSNYAPSGYYMLFVVTNTGVPSEAVWVKL